MEFGVEAEGSEEDSGEEGGSGGEGRGVGGFALGLGRRENIGKEEGERFMHLTEWIDQEGISWVNRRLEEIW